MEDDTREQHENEIGQARTVTGYDNPLYRSLPKLADIDLNDR